MSRAGRKRLHNAKRDAKGRIDRRAYDHQPSAKEVAASQPHRRIVHMDSAHDPICETPFGCLRLVGAIPPREYSAGVRLGYIVRGYRASIAAPRPAESIAGVGQPGHETGPPISPAAAADRKQTYLDCRLSVEHPFGRECWNRVIDVVADGGAFREGSFKGIMDGLRAIATLFERQAQARRSTIHEVPQSTAQT